MGKCLDSKCLDSKCENCVHEEACNAWINHCRMLYDDFIFDVGDCPFYRSRDGRKYIALEHLQKFPIRRDHYDKEHGNEHFVFGIETVIEYAECLPPAEVEGIKYARWHTLADYKYRRIVECTNCHGDFEFSKKMYTQIDILPRCPKCGAKMLGTEQRIAEIEEEIFGRKK